MMASTTMRRRPSSPYANLTGIIVVVFLGLLVLLSMVLPNSPTVVEQVAAQGAATVVGSPTPHIIIASSTPGLPVAVGVGENAAPTPDPFVMGEIVALTTTPDTNWIQMPPTEAPPPPAEPVIAEAAPPAQVIQYVEVPVPVVQEVIVEVPVQVTSEPQPTKEPVVIARPDIPAADNQRQETTIVDKPPRQDSGNPPEHQPEVIAASDFEVPDPNDRCIFVGCLP